MEHWRQDLYQYWLAWTINCIFLNLFRVQLLGIWYSVDVISLTLQLLFLLLQFKTFEIASKFFSVVWRSKPVLQVLQWGKGFKTCRQNVYGEFKMIYSYMTFILIQIVRESQIMRTCYEFLAFLDNIWAISYSSPHSLSHMLGCVYASMFMLHKSRLSDGGWKPYSKPHLFVLFEILFTNSKSFF